MNIEHQNSDISDLVRRSSHGDLSAFRSLMESQQRYVFLLAFRLLRDEEEAKDVVQEAFIRVWKNIAKVDPEMTFTTWLYKIAVNISYDRLRSRSRRKSIFGFAAGLFELSDIPDARDAQEELETLDLCEQVLSLASKLPPAQNLVFHLRDVEDLSIEEISKIAGMSIGSVKSNLCHARKRIRLAVAAMQEGT